MTTKKLLFHTALIYLIFLFPNIIKAQDSEVKTQKIENEFQPRSYLGISYKPIDKLKISLSPELRFDEDFSIDKYLFETELDYYPFKILKIGSCYRLAGKIKKKKKTEYSSRIGFKISAKKEFFHFTPSADIVYYIYYEDEESLSYLAYKLGLSYEFNNPSLTPYFSYELYQSLDNNSIYKNRFVAGVEYSLTKRSSLDLCYKLDYYVSKYKNKHILILGYNLKF